MTPPKLCGDCGTQMDVMPELYALPGLDPTVSGLQFNFSRAVPITVYICPGCGRFKFMSAMMLGNVELPEAPAAEALPPKSASTEQELAPTVEKGTDE